MAEKKEWKEGERAVVKGKKGQSATLISTGLLRLECADCIEGPDRGKEEEPGIFFMKGDYANYCPTCGGKNIKRNWTRPMTVLVPEEEASFLAHPKSEQ